MKDTTLESLEGRRNRSITPPPDIVKKRQQQQAANQAAYQRAHHKPSSNIEHVRYNEDERKQRQAQFSSRPQESDRQPSGEYRVLADIGNDSLFLVLDLRQHGSRPYVARVGVEVPQSVLSRES